jgi:hypothetical protein
MDPMNNSMKIISSSLILLAATTALAETRTVRKTFQLRSAQGLEIEVKADVQESETDAFGNQNRNLTSISVETDKFQSFRVVIVLKCSALHYPNSWSYQSSFIMDAVQASGGAPYLASSYETRQLEYAGFGGDSDTCRTELALVMNDQWQTDPVNGSNNFVLDL